MTNVSTIQVIESKMIIYRFIGNPEHIITTLSNGQLWFSKVEDFNDPFEWKFRYKIDIKRDKDAIRQYVEVNTFSLPPEEKLKRFKKYIDSPSLLEFELNRPFIKFYDQGVCCFAEEENIKNVLMWAHYANSYKGIALGFNDENIEINHVDNFKNGILIFKPLIRRVIYDNHKRFINPFDKYRLDILDTKYMKTKDWEHEKEVRMVSPKFGMHAFNKLNLAEIVFGINTPTNLKSAILDIIRNEQEYANVKIKYCKIVENELNIEAC
jgi:Protein of unknown function (DUF2971)